MRFLSQVYVIARGSVGGITYVANQFHQLIARARTSPVNPNTSLQTAIRSAFSGAETTWKNLTSPERNRWALYAAATPRQNPLGPIFLTGRLFARGIHSLRDFLTSQYAAIFIPTDLAPLTPGMRSISQVASAPPLGPGTGVAIAFVNLLGNPDVVAFAQLSQAFDPTRNSYKGPWDTSRNIIQAVGAGTSPIIEFLSLTLDKAYFIRLRCIDKDGPHKISEEFIVRAIAVTVGP